MKLKYLAVLLFFLHISCNEKRLIPPVGYLPVAKGKCSSDSLNSYHFIIPEHHTGKLPLLIILDSGGDGLMAVNKIGPALTRMPCVAIGSDLVRNNYPAYDQAIGKLIDDACLKFPVSKERVFIAGFSGGARMAFEYGRTHPVKGILMCGAGPGGNSLNLPCPVYMIAGTTDFNFAEMYYNPLKKPGQFMLMSDYFKGSHQWPPTETLKDGLLFLMANSVPDGQEMLKQESASLCTKTDSLLDRKEMLIAVKTVEKAIRFDLHNKTARRQMKEIRSNSGIGRDVNNIESDLQQENRIMQAYSLSSMEKDSIWWANELEQLSREVSSHEGESKDHYLRIKGFLGILFFSRLNNLIRSEPGNKQIVHLLAAYKTAEPENPDVYYYMAFFDWKRGNETRCRKNMSLALSLGFKDWVRLGNDLPQLLPEFRR